MSEESIYEEKKREMIERTKEYKKQEVSEMEGNENKKPIIEVLKTIKDPELDMDIWNLGLIYGIDVEEKDVEVHMTFTSPTCPYGAMILDSVKTRIGKQGYNEPKIDLVFNPYWEPSEDLKEMLGIN
jgi:metal-sulfur cluster biosynthetic enzyme